MAERVDGKPTMRRFRQYMRNGFRRGQTGQAIIVLALGFVALLGFVGIVTDISLLFVRYSSLSRAVDAAAVAAAGQMRRVLDGTDTRGTGTTADDIDIIGEAASNASLALAARSYIEAYGISPETVLVETCRVQRFRRDILVSDNGTPGDTSDDIWDRGRPVDRNGVDLYIGSPPAPNPAANAEDLNLYEELCTDEELKLVRVTAQIGAPTTFMRLLGYGEVTLTVSAISQTAVLDVVLVMDVSESMLTATRYSDFENDDPEVDLGWRDGSGNRIGYGVRYLPLHHRYIRAIAGGYAAGLPVQPGLPYPQMGTEVPEAWEWGDITTLSQNQVLTYGRPGYPDLVNDTADAYLYNAYTWVPDGGAAGEAPGYPQVAPPNPLCGVRIWPGSAYSRVAMPTWLRREMVRDSAGDPAPFADVAAFQAAYFTTADLTSGTVLYNGFVPQYNYYGCCNDPNGDGNFSDLVCQPFRQARDAANGFLERLDFLRGDRVAFVVFDRTASLLDPDGVGSQTAMMETQNDLVDSGGVTIRRGAEEVLNSLVGVRAEKSFYADTDNDGDWDALLSNEAPRSINYFNDTPLANIVDQPTFNACPLDTVEMTSQYGPSGAYVRWDGASTSLIVRSTNNTDNDTVLDDVTTRLDRAGQMPSWVFTLDAGVWGAQSINGGFSRQRDYSYEYRASCAGTNIGGALGEGNYALFLNGRREGSVWLMVMLSDGAAGASNPVSRFDGGTTAFEATAPQLFATNTRTGTYVNPWDPTDPANGTTVTMPVIEPVQGEYGAYGLCPYGTSSAPGQLVLDRLFPFCSDLRPETRTYCGEPFVADDPSIVIVDNPDNPSCEDYYDVDDYARDWADWIGLTNLQGKVNGGADQLVPTIFTIGFGLNFGYDANGNPIPPCTATDYDCLRGISATNPNLNYIPDYLGEELLRYIADVGDNSRIDWDYWQFQMGARIRNGISAGQTQYGPRGACELPEEDLPPVANARELYLPLPPRQSCGNYYVAATEEDLNRVFNEIASRMFTRLSQ